MSENLSLAGDSLTGNPPDGQNPASTRRRIAPWQLFVTVLPLIFIIFLAIALRWQIVSEGRAAGIAPDFEFTTFSGETVRL
jgi:hypothetical protein